MFFPPVLHRLFVRFTHLDLVKLALEQPCSRARRRRAHTCSFVVVVAIVTVDNDVELGQILNDNVHQREVPGGHRVGDGTTWGHNVSACSATELDTAEREYACCAHRVGDGST